MQLIVKHSLHEAPARTNLLRPAHPVPQKEASAEPLAAALSLRLRLFRLRALQLMHCKAHMGLRLAQGLRPPLLLLFHVLLREDVT